VLTRCRTGKTAKIGQLLSPILPPNILCIGLNYTKHYEEGAKKRGIALPLKPVIFMKTSNTVLPHGGEIWRPNMAGEDDALNPEPDAQSNGNNAGALDFVSQRSSTHACTQDMQAVFACDACVYSEDSL